MMAGYHLLEAQAKAATREDYDVSLKAAATPAIDSSNRVLIEERTVVFTRGKKGQDYPDYKEATVKYPQITGLRNQIVLRKLQTTFSLKSVFGQSLKEIQTEFQETWWLSNISYKVNYNKNSLLDITFTIDGIGAYPSSYDKHVAASLKTGQALKAADLFRRESVGALASQLNKSMQVEVHQAIAAAKQQGEDIEQRLDNQKFQVKNLDDFSLNDRGVTFFYDFGFPHVIKALEPSGQYFLSYQQLRPYIKQNGALRFSLRSDTSLQMLSKPSSSISVRSLTQAL